MRCGMTISGYTVAPHSLIGSPEIGLFSSRERNFAKYQTRNFRQLVSQFSVVSHSKDTAHELR